MPRTRMRVSDLAPGDFVYGLEVIDKKRQTVKRDGRIVDMFLDKDGYSTRITLDTGETSRAYSPTEWVQAYI